jgi:acyl-CoA synthetase (NDP forming)
MPPRGAREAIHALLHPRTIAVVGATESPGYGARLMSNLMNAGFTGRVVPVNPNRAAVFGLPCVPSIADAPGEVDLAAIVIPAPAVPGTLSAAGARGVPAALVISAGFAEAAGKGAALQEMVAGVAAVGGPRVCGPNCLGVANVAAGIWATANVLAPIDDRLRSGGIAVVSQSGATAFGPLLAAARDRGIGLRYVVSSGNEADLTTADFIDYFVADRAVAAVALVLEGVRDGAAFRRSVESALAADKPVVVLKLGRTPAGAAAALTHTAAMTGQDDVFDAFCRQHGLARVDDWDALLETADGVAKARRPRGRRVAIVSHSGGIGGLLADACEARGLEVPRLAAATEARLAAILDGRGAARNPADVTGHYDRESFAEILDLLARDENADALVVGTAGGPHVVARIEAAAARTTRPLVVCWTGGLEETEALRALRQSPVPVTYQPSACARVLSSLAAWAAGRRLLGEPLVRSRDGAAWRKLAGAVAVSGGDPLPEAVGLALLRDAGVPAVASARLPAVDDPRRLPGALRDAGLRYPVALKVDSPDLTHKSDAGGVALGVRSDEELVAAAARVLAGVRAARPKARIRGLTAAAMAPEGVEVLLGFDHDPQLGPVIMVGLGGVLAEALRARAWRLLPIRAEEADALVDEVPGLGRLLTGARGRPPADRAALRDAILAFAGWAADAAGSVRSAEVNPLVVLPAGRGALAVDCLLIPSA